MDQVCGPWRKQFSNSKKQHYWFNPTNGQSLWANDTLPHGWAFKVEREGAAPLYVHLITGAQQSTVPEQTASGAGAVASEPSQLSFQASQSAGDDLQSKAYIPDPAHPGGPGMNVPANIRSKRDYLLGHGIPEGNRWNLQVDEVALYSITEGRLAESMTAMIVDAVRTHWAQHGPWATQASSTSTADAAQTFTITDATSAVGGNVLSFARHGCIRHVHGIELSAQRAAMCAHNARVANVHAKVTMHHGDAVSTIQNATWPTDVVFMDPPWGGPAYASAELLDMFLGQVDVADWTVALTCPGAIGAGGQGSDAAASQQGKAGLYADIPSGHVKAKMVAIKAPLNYNVEGLRAKLATAGTGASVISHVPMHKMQLILVQAAPQYKLYIPPSAGQKRQRDVDAEVGDGNGSKRVKEAVPATGAGAASASSSGPAATVLEGAVSPTAAFELLVRSQNPPLLLSSTGLFLRPSQTLKQFVLQKGILPLQLTQATTGANAMQMNLPGAPVIPCASEVHAEVGGGNHVLYSPAGELLCLANVGAGGQPEQGAVLAFKQPGGTPSGTQCVWRLHAMFDVESAIYNGGVPAPIMTALCLPMLVDKTVAGEGERGRVSRGTPQSSTTAERMVVKLQPMDPRVVKETQLLSLLGPENGGPVDECLCVPVAIAMDRGLWAHVPGAERCIQIQQDAGTPVENLLAASGGKLPMEVVVPLFKRLLRALHAVHARGLLHADVHAGNLLVPSTGSSASASSAGAAVTPEQAAQARVIDLGSLCLLHGGVYKGTARGGRWDVMAPEQFGPARWGLGDVTLTPAADIYAAAATAVHLLIGYRPFAPPGEDGAGQPGSGKLTVEGCKGAALRDGKAMETALRAVLATAEPSTAAAANGGSQGREAFLTLLLRCLQPLPAHRPQSAAEVLARLE